MHQHNPEANSAATLELGGLSDLQHVSLCETLDRVLNKGVVVAGEVTISVAEVDLVYLVFTSCSVPWRPHDAVNQAAQVRALRWGRIMPMQLDEMARVESESLSDFARVMQPGTAPATLREDNGMPARLRLNLDPDSVKNGLGQLVLTLVKLLHELLERQAIRRIDAGSLDEGQIERLGLTLMRQAEEIERLRKEFGLDEEDLNLDLGPLGKLL